MINNKIQIHIEIGYFFKGCGQKDLEHILADHTIAKTINNIHREGDF